MKFTPEPAPISRTFPFTRRIAVSLWSGSLAQSLDPQAIWFDTSVTRDVVGKHSLHGVKNLVAGSDWYIILGIISFANPFINISFLATCRITE